MLRTLVIACFALGLAGCNVFGSLENCEDDGDCQMGARCHPEGKFCEGEDANVLIGATLPLTGDLTSVGRDLQDGLTLVESVVNAQGGIFGRELGLALIGDDTTEEGAVANVRSLVRNGADAIIGPLTSDQVLATEDIAYQAHVLQIVPAAGAPGLGDSQPERDRYLFQAISPVRSGSGAAIALFAQEGPAGASACRRMAIVHSDDSIGIAYRDAVTELFPKTGGCIAFTRSLSSTMPVDPVDLASDLVAAEPDCATIVAFRDEAIDILGEFKTATASDPRFDDFFWIGTTPLHTDAFIEASALDPRDPGNGIYGADEETRPNTREYNELREAYNEEFGRPDAAELPIFVSNTYDAAMIAVLAIVRAGNAFDRERIRDSVYANSGIDGSRTAIGPLDYGEAVMAMRRGDSIHYQGASGSLIFDDFGRVSSPTTIWKVQGGMFVTEGAYVEDDIRALLELPDMASACE